MNENRFIHFLTGTLDNPLDFTARMTYSCLATMTGQHGRGISLNKLASMTGLDRARAIPRAIETLKTMELVKRKDGKWFAVDDPQLWRARETANSEHWHLAYVYFTLYLPAHDCPLTPRQNAVLCFLQGRKQRTITGLAGCLGIATNTARRAVKKLRRLGYVKGLTVLDVPAELWQGSSPAPKAPDRRVKAPVKKIVEQGKASTKWIDAFGIKMEDANFQENTAEKINGHAAKLRRFKFSDKEILFFGGMLKRVHKDCGDCGLMTFVNNWGFTIDKAQEVTNRNRQLGKFAGPNSSGILKVETVDLMMATQNAARATAGLTY